MNVFLVITLSFISSYLTYHLHNNKILTTIRSSCIVTIACYFLVSLLSMTLDINNDLLLRASFGGSFVGMCSVSVVNRTELAIVTSLYVGLFVFVLGKLPYSGGALGFLVFISAASFIVLRNFKDKSSKQ